MCVFQRDTLSLWGFDGQSMNVLILMICWCGVLGHILFDFFPSSGIDVVFGVVIFLGALCLTVLLVSLDAE